ncbi:MAG: hypothetical protein J6K29_08175 [Clostridia bacterium]|nr:hypothetical protein [Clostridia bacterium]
MTHLPRFLVPVLTFILTVGLLSACAVPDAPSSVQTPGADLDSLDHPTETIQNESTEEHLEEVTNFPVLTEAEKQVQCVYHNEFDSENVYVRHWDIAGTARECPYTSEEILSAVSLGDDIMDVYDRIGYPTYRDTPSTFLSGRRLDLFTMDYTTSDGDVIFICYRLAGCTEDDYRYVVTALSSSRDTIPYTSMDFDTKVRLQVLPVFMAVEQVGVDYLLEKEIITPYEATLYAAEETVYQERLADQTITE